MKKLSKVVLAFVLLLGSKGLNNAGTGTFKNGAFNFCVSVRFNATADQLQKIRTGFQQASELLEDATNGQHYFGNISIVNNDKSSGVNADFWIVSSTSPFLIKGQSNAPTGTYGIKGQRAIMKFAEFEGLIRNPSGIEVLNAARTIVHEFAHYAYALRDEYLGPSDTPAECAAPSTAFSIVSAHQLTRKIFHMLKDLGGLDLKILWPAQENNLPRVDQVTRVDAQR